MSILVMHLCYGESRFSSEQIILLQKNKCTYPAPIKHYSLQKKATQKNNDMFSQELLNGLALLYVIVKTYTCYTALHNPHERSWVHTFMRAITPGIMQNLITQGHFGFEVAAIILETLLYKTVAQGVMACATGNIFDAFEYVVYRSKKLISVCL